MSKFKNNKILKILSIFLVPIFFGQNTFLNADFADFSFSQNFSNKKNMNYSEIILGLGVGTLSDYFVAKNSNLGKVIIIKDLHANSEVQNNIFSILEAIDKNYNVFNKYSFNDVFVEGGWGNLETNFDLLFSKLLPNSLDSKRIFFDNLINNGLINGAEKFVAFNIDKKLEGIEQADIYSENFNYLVKSLQIRKEANFFIINLINDFIKKKIKNYSTTLIELDNLVVKYRTNKISLIEYMDTFKKFDYYMELNFDHEFPTLMKSYNAEKLLQSFGNFKNITIEAFTIEKILFNKLSKEEFFELQNFRSKLQTDDITKYYFYLQQLIVKNKLQYLLEENFINLKNYFEYLNTLNSLDPTSILIEEKNLIAKISNNLTLTQNQKKFLEFGRIIDNYYRFCNNLALPFEVDDIIKNNDKYLEIILSYANDMIKDEVNLIMLKDCYIKFVEQVENMKNFYFLANKRNFIFAENIEKKLNQNKNDNLILPVIIGGYHAKMVADILKDKKISYIIISPTISKEADNRLYEANVMSQSNYNSFQSIRDIGIGITTLALQSHFQVNSNDEQIRSKAEAILGLVGENNLKSILDIMRDLDEDIKEYAKNLS
ncbi:MAG: hypothetical protein LBF97_07090, partial [Elusimicrobiota bacterium]|nr:hypothetical protein [Elusimicrobiota bacterium]